MANLAGQAVFLSSALRKVLLRTQSTFLLSYITTRLLVTCKKRWEFHYFCTFYITKTIEDTIAAAIKIALMHECSEDTAACVGTGCLSTITSCISPTPLTACRSKSRGLLMSSVP